MKRLEKLRYINVKGEINMNIKYTERETRLIVAWILITCGVLLMADWSISRLEYPRPPYIIDLLFPMVAAAVGVYILKWKIPSELE